MLRRPVDIDGLAGTPPDAIRTLYRVESPALRCPAQRDQGELLIDQSGKRDHAGWASDVGNDEPVEVVIQTSDAQLGRLLRP